MHEALAGDYYHEETESVPEQTWSSSTFFTATVSGMLGIEVNASSHHLTLAPHLPPNWNAVTVRNLRVSDSQIVVHIVQSAGEMRLELENSGPPISVRFDPEIPFGAELKKARLDGRAIRAVVEDHQQDTHVKVDFSVPRGSARLVIGYTGGMAIILKPPQLQIGESSHGIKITALHRSGTAFTVNFDSVTALGTDFEIHTPWTVRDARGATLESMSPGLYRVVIPAHEGDRAGEYQHGTVTLNFTGIK